jgi:GntR family transcriptional regulator of arabinose operon
MNEINQTLYMKIYESLLEKIKSGELKEGDRIPTEMELAEEFQVSRITSRKALDILAEEGYITRTPGKGSFVTSINKKQEQNDSGSVRIQSSSHMIGLVLPDFSASYAMDLLSGIEKEACRCNCGFTFYRTYGRQDLEEKAIDFLLDMGVEGIILMPVHGEHYNPKIFKMVLDPLRACRQISKRNTGTVYWNR